MLIGKRMMSIIIEVVVKVKIYICGYKYYSLFCFLQTKKTFRLTFDYLGI